jgi:pyruvate formate lyase activating enzyme
MKQPRTPVETLLRAFDIVSKTMKYVYLGNVSISGKSNTICPGCGATVISRDRYNTDVSGLTENRCAACDTEIDIVY